MRAALLLPVGLLAACSSDPQGLREIAPSIDRTIPGLTGEVSVLRTEMNVAHVYAENETDLIKVQGFVTAQDRYVQIELMRRFGAGQLGGLIGSLGLTIDASARAQGMKYVAERIWANSSPEVKADMEAYAEGINAYIDAARAGKFAVPEELEIVAGLVGVSSPRDLMEHLTGFDIAALAAVIVSRLGYENTDLERGRTADLIGAAYENAPFAELRKAGLLEDVFRSVVPVYGHVETRPSVATSGQSLRATVRDGAVLERAVKRTKEHLRGLGLTGEDRGSNGWAVSSKGTGGKGAILANDGHLPLTVPSLFYQMCLDTEYFGGGDYRLCGLFFPGLPMLAVGTNGHVAWGQTYLEGDITDWYREELQLGPDGLPEASKFMGEWRTLAKVDEVFQVRKDGGTFDMVTWPRWTTFDGRFIVSIEGDVVKGPDDSAVMGRKVALIDGDWIVPRDANGDGVIEAISYDWTSFDIARTLDAVRGFSRAKSVAEFKEQTRKLIGYAQNVVVADRHGDIMYTGYNGLPCRTAYEKDASGHWKDGQDPQRVLDGTRFGGFTIPVDGDGNVDEAAGCVVPFEVGPRAETPEAGFVLTANHDPLGYTLDNQIANDPWYIGGPYDVGYRAHWIETGLSSQVGSATVESMGKLQATNASALGREYGPVLIASLAKAEMSSSTATAAEKRLADLWASAPRLAEARTRLSTWLSRGAPAESGVETFYATFDDAQRGDAVATMIFNAWLRKLVEGIFADEDVDFAFSVDRNPKTFRTLHRMIAGRGAGNTQNLASFNPATGESIFFDDLRTPYVETSDEIIVKALADTISDLERDFGKTEMAAWLWGLRHQVRFKALLEEVGSGNPLVGLVAFKFALTTERLPLAEEIPAGDARKSLSYFPRSGDWYAVDAGNPGLSGPYTYSSGPVMRMVIRLDDGVVEGQNILPGGQSGVVANDHFADQARYWLGNQTIPIRYTPESVKEASPSRELFHSTP